MEQRVRKRKREGERVRFIYLAQPIDQVKGGDRLSGAGDGAAKAALWALDVRRTALDAGVGLYVPANSFVVPGTLPVGPEIRRINDHALDQCDGLLALLPGGVGTVGVPTEIEASRVAGRPVAIVTDVAHKLWTFTDGTQWTAPYLVTDSPRQALLWLASLGDAEQLTERWSDGVVSTEKLRAAQGLPEPLPFTRADDTVRLPTRAHPDDAGLDLYVNETVKIGPNSFADVDCGLRVELPDGVWGMITGRSSTIRNRRLLVVQGIIDSGYRGPLFTAVWNLADEPTVVEVGERLAQFILFPNVTAGYQPVAVEVLGEGSRGERGFGSSGQ